MQLSSRVGSLKPSVTMAISSQAQVLRTQGKDVISLAAGEPDFDTPEPIRHAVVEAIEKGLTRYTPAPGFLKVREAIAEKVTRENGMDVSPEQVLLTCGAKHAIYMAAQCLVEPGDAVLLPVPAWVSYQPIVELAGGKIIPLPMHQEDGFRVNVDRWKGLAIPPNARGIILNSPSNPTGVCLTRDDLTQLVGWALQRNLWILSDEIYEHILYDGATHTSVASLGPEVAANTITISGFSKSACMTGWRLGWAIAEQDLIKKMSALQSQSNSHVTSFVQWAGIAAANLDPSIVTGMVNAFDERRQYCCSRLDNLGEHCSYVRPNGAFYLFVNISPWLGAKGWTDVEFCQNFLNEKFVGTVPGSAFGQSGFIRISYATSMEKLVEAFDRLEAYLKGA